MTSHKAYKGKIEISLIRSKAILIYTMVKINSHEQIHIKGPLKSQREFNQGNSRTVSLFHMFTYNMCTMFF